jgi:phosphate transport system substrate-binding protein
MDKPQRDNKWRFVLWNRLGTTLLLAAALGVAGCQFPGFEARRQTAMLPPPKPTPKPPEERGVWIVGSPAVAGGLKAASASYAGTPDTQPRVVAGGLNAGIREFCRGVGVEAPDMVLSDRPLRPEETKLCSGKGITITEYTLAPNRYVYVKDAHMMAIPGVRDLTESWGVRGKPAGR